MDIWYYVMTPFTWLLTMFYQFFNNYGVALILFALVVKVLMFPLSLKGKRSMIQMNMISGKVKKLQKQYAKDQAKYNEEVQKLYKKENVNPMGGCLWSMLPLFILLPLYAIIRQPLKYMMGLTAEQISAAAQSLNWTAQAISGGKEFANVGYDQLYLASLITPDKVSAVQAAVGNAIKEIFSINFSFLGVDLSRQPQLGSWREGLMGIGLFLVPVVSALTSILFSIVTTKTNQLNKQQEGNSNKAMMLISPVMSLWIGFSMPAALSIYWIANNVLGLGQELLSGRLLKKDYERAVEEQKRRELEEKEEEKQLRREKAEEKARQAEEARKNKGKKKKDPDEDKMTPEQKAASRVGMRQYARGRAYDPDRYGGVTPYHEELAKETVSSLPQEEPEVKEEAAPIPEEPTLDTELKEINDELDAAIEDVPADEAKED